MPPPNLIPIERSRTLSDLPSLKLADLQALKLKVARLEAALKRVEKAQQINNNHDELDHHDGNSVISEVSYSSSIKSSGRSVSSSLSMSNIPILSNLRRNKNTKKKNKKHRRLPSLSKLGRSRSNSFASRDDFDDVDDDDDDYDDDNVDDVNDDEDNDTALFLKELELELVSTNKCTEAAPALEKKDSMKKNEFNNHIQSSNKKSVNQIGGAVTFKNHKLVSTNKCTEAAPALEKKNSMKSNEFNNHIQTSNKKSVNQIGGVENVPTTVVTFKNHTALTNDIREQTIVEEGPGGPPKPDTLQAWLEWFMGETFCADSTTCGGSTYVTETSCGNSTYCTDVTPRLYSI